MLQKGCQDRHSENKDITPERKAETKKQRDERQTTMLEFLNNLWGLGTE
jgi:hypothetical protein